MSDMDVIRRIAERGIRLAVETDPKFVDLFQHMLDEVQQVPTGEAESLRQQLAEKSAEATRFETMFCYVNADFSKLEQQLAEKDAEIERLRRSVSTAVKLLDVEGPTDVIDLLAASQARERQLREALQLVANRFICWHTAAVEALALPADTSAIEAMIRKAGECMRERCRETAEELQHPHGGTCESQDWCDGIKHSAEAIRALPGVKLEDLK